jgi:hypothetical protein
MAASDLAALRAAGVAALGCYAVHATERVLSGWPEDLLWACHLGTVLIGVGLVGFDRRAGAPLLMIGLCWLAFGTPLWLLDVCSGGELVKTSLFTHVGGPLIGLYGARHVPAPRGMWWRASLALLALQGLCRLVTPPASNVNLSFAVASGWESMFPSFPLYAAMLTALGAASFWLCEALLRRFVCPTVVA